MNCNAPGIAEPMLRLAGLDALRGIAALLVMSGHYEIAFSDTHYFRRAYLAVDLFFMLSGYVMARTYEASMGSALAPAQFLEIRVRRLWPTMAIGTALGALLLAAKVSPGELIPAMFLALAFLPSTVAPPSLFPFNLPAWSIFYEMLANIAHCTVLYRLRTTTLLSALPLLIFPMIWFATADHLAAGATWPEMVTAVPRVFIPYLIGIAIHRNSKTPRFPLLWAIIPIAVAAAFRSVWAETLFVVAACPLLVYAGLRPLPKWLDRPSAIAGAMSFPIYAVHFPISHLIHDVWLASLCTFVISAAICLWGQRGRKTERVAVTR